MRTNKKVVKDSTVGFETTGDFLRAIKQLEKIRDKANISPFKPQYLIIPKRLYKRITSIPIPKNREWRAVHSQWGYTIASPLPHLIEEEVKRLKRLGFNSVVQEISIRPKSLKAKGDKK